MTLQTEKDVDENQWKYEISKLSCKLKNSVFKFIRMFIQFMETITKHES